MGKPCVVIELDPDDLESGQTVLTAALSLFHVDAEVVITLTGVDEPSHNHGEVVAELCRHIAGEAPLPDIVLESAVESSRRDPLVRVQARQDVAGTVEAIVMLTSIAMRTWNSDDFLLTASHSSAGHATKQQGQKPDAHEWVEQRDALIAQRDEVTPADAPLLVVAVVASESSFLLVEPVLDQLVQSRQAVEVVIADIGSHKATSRLRSLLRARGWIPRSADWFTSRLQNPRFGLAVALYSDRIDDAWPDEVTPKRAAEYGVRVSYVCGTQERLEDDVLDRVYDNETHRVAWRIYAENERQKLLFEAHLVVGVDSVRVVGSLRAHRSLHRASHVDDGWLSSRIAGRKTILWVPDVLFRGGKSDLKLLADAAVTYAQDRPDVVLIVRLGPERADDLKHLRGGQELVERLRAAERKLENVIVDMEEDSAPVVSVAQALVSGVNGPIAEFFVRELPVAYVELSGRNAMSKGAEYVLACQVVRDEGQMFDFVDDVREDRDPMAYSRKMAAAHYFKLEDGRVGERLSDDLIFSVLVERSPVNGKLCGVERIPLLAVAMIVKNEERFLPGALESIGKLGEIVDEVCIYDTGSDDATIDLAEQWGARVMRGFWDGDFARAKNEALNMCASRWVLVLDADERVSANADILARALAQGLTANAGLVDALDVTMRDIRPDVAHSTNSWSAHRLLRRANVEFVGAVHEDVYRLNGEIVESVPLDESVISIDHLGYTDDETVRAKLLRNLDIAEAEVVAREQEKDDEGLIRALVDRARSNAGRGEFQAALVDYEQVRHMSTGRRYRWWGMELYADLLIALGRLSEAQQVVEELELEGASATYADWLRARVWEARGEYSEALDLLAQHDFVVSSLGVTSGRAQHVEDMVSLAIRADRVEEATTYLISLMVVEGRVGGWGPYLIGLWGQRPAAVLAERLLEARGAHIDTVLAEVDQSGGIGPEVAAIARRWRVADASAIPVRS